VVGISGVGKGTLVRAQVAAECLAPVVGYVVAGDEVVFVEVEDDLDEEFGDRPERVHGSNGRGIAMSGLEVVYFLYGQPRYVANLIDSGVRFGSSIELNQHAVLCPASHTLK